MSSFQLLHPHRFIFAWLLTQFSYLIFNDLQYHLISKFTTYHVSDTCFLFSLSSGELAYPPPKTLLFQWLWVS